LNNTEEEFGLAVNQGVEPRFTSHYQ